MGDPDAAPSPAPARAPPYNILLIRYGEVALKSNQTRRRMERDLVRQLKAVLGLAGVAYGKYRVEPGRIFFYFAREILARARALFRGVVGVYSVSPCFQTTATLDHVTRRAVELARVVIPPGASFAIRARRRMGEHPFSSRDVAIEAGSAILDALGDAGVHVNLTRPAVTIYVEVRHQLAYLYHRKYPAIGGMPLESQAPLLASQLGRVEDLLAALLLVKRGCRVVPVVFEMAGWPAPGTTGVAAVLDDPPGQLALAEELCVTAPNPDDETGSPVDEAKPPVPWAPALLRYFRAWMPGSPLVAAVVPFRAAHARVLETFAGNAPLACLACHQLRQRVLGALARRVSTGRRDHVRSCCDGDNAFRGCPVSPALYRHVARSAEFWTFHPVIVASPGDMHEQWRRFISLGVARPPPRLASYCPLALPAPAALETHHPAPGSAFTGLGPVTEDQVAEVATRLDLAALATQLATATRVVVVPPR